MALAMQNIPRCFKQSKTILKSLEIWPANVKHIHVSSALNKTQAGKYKVTINRSKPLTYEQAITPLEIAEKKGFNSLNTAQLEGTFTEREQIGQDLPHKMFVEDMFIRKFLQGTFPESICSEIIIKRHHNLVRIAAIVDRKLRARQIYFLIGYSEELLSYWLKCPVKMELQTIETKDELIYKYI